MVAGVKVAVADIGAEGVVGSARDQGKVDAGV